MKIGIAYDLRTWYLEQGFGMEETAEFDKESTIEGIEKVIASLGFETERIGRATSKSTTHYNRAFCKCR